MKNQADWLKAANEQISDLCDLIDVWNALSQLWPGYPNDAVDVDREGCFV